ncbi:MAG: ChrR family anti-sigma-E factor [Caulobacteraceae bacterium]|nr:ChrR family anti-sigma-E factor [Caulobacteraceae bacterium]
MSPAPAPTDNDKKTMTLSHHLSDALIVDYASGSMGRAQSLVVATHLHACAACRGRVAQAEAVGGALLEEIASTPLAPDALDRALARIERPREAAAPEAAAGHARQPADWISVPVEVAEAAARRRWVAPGVWVAPVDVGSGDGALTYLLRVGQGMRMPQHTHAGCELTLVLKGAFDDAGVRFGPGDISEADDAVEHSPVIAAGQECVCLVACDNRLIVKDWLGRVVQAYAGI